MLSNTALRNRAFISSALAILSRRMHSRKPISRKELVSLTLASRPPGYYVDFDSAYRKVSHLLRHPAPESPSLSAQRWLEITERVRGLMEGPRQMSLTQALTFVINFVRPSRYFITPSTAEKILARATTTTLLPKT